MSKVEIMYGYHIEPYMGCKKIRVAYIKNNKEQNAVFMNYSTDGKDYKLVEDNHYARNGLREVEQKEISTILNNNLMEIYAQN